MQAQATGKSRKSPWPMLLVALGMALLAGSGGYLLGAAGKTWASSSLRATFDALSGWDLLALPLVALLVLAVHEAGHLAGGMSRGMRFLMFIAGPLGWFRGAQGIHFRWVWNLSTLGGLAAAIPVPGQPLKPQLMRLVIGGPLASLLLALLGFAAMAWSPGRVGAYGLIVGGLSLAIFMVTALPLRTGGFMSDGMQLLELGRNPAMVDRRVRLIGLMGSSMSGTRPRDYDARELAQAQAITGDEPLYDVTVWIHSYAHALDRGDLKAAADWLDRVEAAFDAYPDGFRQSLATELALFEALHRRRLTIAESWMARAKGGIVEDSRRSLAEAAIAILQGNRDTALNALAQARRKLGQSLDAGTAKMSADQIDTLHQALASKPG
jgi:hypothetical protein